ncbi:hypothetical protein ACTWP6_22870 [Mycobacterium sp. 4D054]|uniref:hypothetical protein n=1 Tax=Mycobacterium sp. 4D054 TaxID=3457440 RepID=UPI003FD43F9D
MTITMPARVKALVHWRSHHPRRVRTDWDLHGHPHHLNFVESALLSREMDRL